MASTLLRAEDLDAAWSRQEWKRVYLFAGPETFLMDEALQKIAVAKGADAAGSIDHDRLDGESASTESILETCRTVPFAGGVRLVEVQNASRLSPDSQKRLAESLARLPESVHLILIWGRDWRREDAEKPLINAVGKAGSVVIFWPLFPEQAQRWVLQRAKRYQKSLAPEAAAWLVQETEQGLRFLDQELQKACCYVGSRPAISLEDMQAAFGYRRAASPYAWIDAIRQKNASRALETLDRLLEEGEEPIRLLAMVSGSVRDWLEVKGSPEAPDVFRRFRLKRGEEDAFRKDLARRTEGELLEGLSGCVEAQLEAKTGKENPEMALTLLTLRLCGLGV